MALQSLKSKVKYRISRSKGVLFTPKDFLDLSDHDQIGRALRQLVNDETLIKSGHGRYTKATQSPLTQNPISEKKLFTPSTPVTTVKGCAFRKTAYSRKPIKNTNATLSEKKPTWDDFFNQKSAFSDDFLVPREDFEPQERDFF